MSLKRRAAAIVALGIVVVGVSGCSTTVAFEPAPDANNPLCANVMVNLPKALQANDPAVTLDRVWTNAQSTGAWGTPVEVLFRCGEEVPGASTDPCQTFQGFDWIIDDSDAPWFRMTVFGRDPAIQVYFNSEVISSTEVLGRIGKAAQDLPKTGACIDRPVG